MKYATICSGIEAATVAWEPLGWQPQFFSEIAPFPCRLLETRFPDVPNYGDMTGYKEFPHHDLDLIIGGTPCQSFSMSGKRKGLTDERGNLALVFIETLRKYRPRWVIWENVPGVLSSGHSRDFGTFLTKMAECGYYGAWRVLDAQYFGVPQQRRRVFFVGYLGDWQPAAEVLFESEGLRGDTGAQSASEENHTGSVDNSVEARFFRRLGNGYYKQDSVASTCCCNDLSADKSDIIMLNMTKGDGKYWRDDAAYSLRSQKVDAVCLNKRLRRLTPLEYERLMGFPDRWMDIDGASDTRRYAACGNSQSIDVVRWLGQRIEMVENRK